MKMLINILLVTVQIGCIQESKNQLSNELCYCVRFSNENSAYNELFVTESGQYFFDGTLGEVFDEIKDTSEHIDLLERLNNASSTERKKNILKNYIKFNTGLGYKIPLKIEFINVDNCEAGIEEYKNSANERMLSHLQDNNSLSDSTIDFIDIVDEL